MEQAQIKDSAPGAQDRILDAAEQTFAEDGFAGAGMKSIAVRAGVAQGLLHYHFENKEGLYAAVIARRSGFINAARRALLARVDLSDGDATEQIMTALLRPPLGPEGGGQAYARIFGGLAGGDARDVALVREHYDPTAKVFIAALQKLYPQASPQTLSWGYTMAIGALMSALGMQGRADRLVGKGNQGSDTDAVVARLVNYAVGGLERLIAEEAASN